MEEAARILQTYFRAASDEPDMKNAAKFRYPS
jgi:hypothetical protein